MTRFSAPLKVKREFEDTTVARVDSSGSAVFTGGLSVNGPVQVSGSASYTGGLHVAGAVDVSGSARFNGPIIAGDSGQIGGVVMTQSTTVISSASGPSGIRLPALSQIVDMVMHVRASASGNVGGMLVRVGTSGDEDQFATILTSAIGTYRIGGAGNVVGTAVSAAAWQSVGAAASQIHIDVTAQTSTTQTDKYDGILSVFYRMRSS